jgi:hypothetical protein
MYTGFSKAFASLMCLARRSERAARAGTFERILGILPKVRRLGRGYSDRS